jgi:hypothetical protein
MVFLQKKTRKTICNVLKIQKEQISMRTRFETRLAELGKEYEKGLNELRELETRQASLRQTMLRISGAMQVIEEELKRPDPATASDQSDRGEEE